MGAAIIAITICHINQFIGVHKGLQSGLANEFLYASAAVGVDIFFFFSLVGLGFSLENNKLVNFYKHRIKRILPAYLLFMVIVLSLFFPNSSLNDKWGLFSQQITGVSATKYVAQRIEWYVPSLILLYALYPLAFRFVKWIHRYRTIELCFLCVTIFSSYIFGLFFVGLFAFRLPLYYLAILSFFYIKDGNKNQLGIIYIIAAAFSFIVKNELLSYALIIPLFLFVIDNYINDLSENKWAKSISWLGQYTLEIYLAQVVATKYLIKELSTNNIVIIVWTVILSTIMISFILNVFQRLVGNFAGYLSDEIKQSKKGTTRLGWVDAAKGMAMLIIMWGHVQQPSLLKTWLSSFHVPVFLVLSGLLMARKGSIVCSGGGKLLINKLLRPYLTFSIIAICCFLLNDIIISGSFTGVKMLIINIYKTLTAFGIKAIWFIPSYFIASYIFCKTFRYSLKCQILLLLMWCLVGIGGSELLCYLKDNIKDSFYYDVAYFPIAAVLRGVACTYYLVLGRFVYVIYELWRYKPYLKIIVIISCTLCFACSFYFSQSLYGTNFSLLMLGSNPYMSFICGAWGAVWFITFFYLIRKYYVFPLLQYVGRKSLVIMGTHMSMLLTTITPLLLGKIFMMPLSGTFYYYIFGVGCVGLMLILEIPIIWLFDGRFRSLVSKN